MAVAVAHPSPNLSPRAFQVVLALVIALAVAAGALWTLAGVRAERNAVANLPAADRLALFRHEADAFRELCTGTDVSPGLLRHCSERAEFLGQFPECDAGCHAMVRERAPRPTR